MSSKNQAIVSGLLGLGVVGFATATALPFNDRIEFKIGNRLESRPAWLVPAKAEFKGIERGYGGIKILLAMLATGGMVAVMLIARKEGEQEPIRQRIKQYKNRAFEFGFAAESAYQMATTQTRYKKLAEADEVDFEGQIEQAYMESLGIDPSAQQPLLSGTATIDSVANPSDKVQQSTSPAIGQKQDGPKLPKLTNYPAVLLYGPQGSGKTFLAEEEIKERKQAGHKVTALDPHAGFNSWRDCEVVGAGMDYQAIDAELADFAAEVKRRYERIRKEPNPQFQPWTFVCDEFTNWASRCKASGDFFQAALSDIRKAKLYVLFVSHARTLAGLGDAKGMAATRDAALLEIELLGQIDPVTTEAVPKFEALVKLPGQSQANRTLVKLVKHPTPKNATVDDVPIGNTPNTSENSGTPKNTQEPEPEQPGNPTEHREHFSEMLEQLLAGTAEKAVFAADSPLEQEDKMKLAKLVIAQDLGQEKTIWLLWNIRRGGRNHDRYTDAREALERLIKGEQNNG
jgi:hypothetical protein